MTCDARLLLSTAVLLTPLPVLAGEPASGKPSPERGYELLRTKPYLPPDFDQQVFDSLWRFWPAEERAEAKTSDPDERRRLTLEHYGLTESPDDLGPALGYVDDGRGGWVMNCLTCHGGKIDGRVVPGLPNTRLELHTLIEDVRKAKLLQLKRPSHMDLVSARIPLGGSKGTTNSVVFGIVVGAYRKPDMSVVPSFRVPGLVHHDMDAPPFWNVKRKQSLYCDGFAPKGHRPLVQFVLHTDNDRETIYSWEDDFRHVLAWIESVEAPDYPWPVDEDLVRAGAKVFGNHCARCHGTYGPDGRYPEKTIPIDVVGTDPVRLKALTVEHRRRLKRSWMSHYGKDPVEVDPGGYVAPPLNGVWASAPYFHNGSVPTLWHVLHPEERPVVWKRSGEEYDRERIGLPVETFGDVPKRVRSGAERRRYFDTRLPSKSAGGHDFPSDLSEEQRRAVLEYLKTL